MFNFIQLFTEVLRDNKTTRDWCVNAGLLMSTPCCPICCSGMILREKGNYTEYRCQKRGISAHYKSISLTKDSWFAGSHFPIDKILIITYMFSVRNTKYEDIIRETSAEDSKTSRETVTDWLHSCREVTLNWCIEEESKEKIGGEGVVVEIDETKIGKRKFSKGRMVEGVWIFGLIEIEVGEVERRGGKFRLEVCPNNRRDAQTLLPLIQKHVKIGTTIVSDSWKGYYCLSENGFEHFTVNHSNEFVNSDTGANTQTIESNWRPLKRKINSGINPSRMQMHLYEYLWRRHVAHNKLDNFLFFIDCFKKLYNPNMQNSYKHLREN